MNNKISFFNLINLEHKPKARQDKKYPQKIRKINMQQRKKKQKNNLFGTWAPATWPRG